MGKKIIDFVTRRNALRGRKSKAGGAGEIKSHSIIYTPATIVISTCILLIADKRARMFIWSMQEWRKVYRWNKQLHLSMSPRLFRL